MERKRSTQTIEQARAAELRAHLIRKICAHITTDGVLDTSIPGLSLYRQSTCTACNSATYEPRLIVFVQGQKRIELGNTAYLCDETRFLLASVDLPVISQVTKASPEKPILTLMLKLEMPEVRRLLSEEELPVNGEPADARGMSVGVTSVELLGACSTCSTHPKTFPSSAASFSAKSSTACCAAPRAGISAASPPSVSRVTAPPKLSPGCA